MLPSTPPSKVAIRAYLHTRLKQHEPPPSIAEIRRQLGWELPPHGANKSVNR